MRNLLLNKNFLTYGCLGIGVFCIMVQLIGVLTIAELQDQIHRSRETRYVEYTK